MKFIRFFSVLLLLMPGVCWGGDVGEFQNASKLLTAARRGDVQTVQVLIDSGVDVNYTDATGMSLVCTAVMNNDKRAIQILQMYGADASQCDKQIKNYKQKTRVAKSGEDFGFFSGLSSSHVIALSALGVAAVIGGVVLLTKVLDDNDGHSSSGTNDSRPNNNNSGESSTTDANKLFAQNLPYGPACSGSECPNDFSFWETTNSQDFDYMSTGNSFNYLMVARAYNAFVRGYLGMSTIRISSDLAPFDLSTLPYTTVPGGGKPVNVAMITESGVNDTADTSAVDGLIPWIDSAKISIIQSACASDVNSSACVAALANAVNVSHKYYNYSGDSVATDERSGFDLSGGTSVFGSASDSDTKLAKIIAGWEEGGRSSGDFYGFIPNGQLVVYKTGNGESGVSDYKNYAAIKKALNLKVSGEYVSDVVANLALVDGSENLSYWNVDYAKVVNDALTTLPAQKTAFLNLIDMKYNLLNTDDNLADGNPADDASTVFVSLGNNQNHILVNSAGHSLFGTGLGQSMVAQTAIFENFAPVIYTDLQNLFMTVVAVEPANGTDGDTIDGYSAANAGKLQLSAWADENDDSIIYYSRMCGLTGNGNGGAMNPWCFAAPGVTDLDAAAAMAGSVALVKSAFNYMTPKQIFLLLALTADGPYLGTDPETGNGWASSDDSDLIAYLKTMYNLPGNLNSSDAQYLESFKNAFGYGMINLERATRPGTNVYFYSSDKDTIVTSSGNAYWRTGTTTTTSSRASSVLSLTGRGAINTSFFDVLESVDGSISLPRVWNMNLAENNYSKHGFYMGDVLSDFNIDSTNKRTNQIGNLTFDMALSSRAYSDNLNGLDNLRVAFVNEKYDMDAQYQRFLTDGQSRFNGRANGVLSLVSNSVVGGAKYKFGNFAFGGRAFSGSITDENLLENDPIVSSQFEPMRLGFANGASMDAGYKNDKFAFNVSVGNLHEDNTVLGMYSDGLLTMRGGNTQYIDVTSEYKILENMKLYARGTFANTHIDKIDGIISKVSDVKSNAFAFGADVGGFELTAAMPLAVTDGKMGYDYAELDVVENENGYDIAINNPHVEYVDLATQKRELRFSASFKKSIGEWTSAGLGMIYRVHPNNMDVFGNESIFMFKLHHRLGI